MSGFSPEDFDLLHMTQAIGVELMNIITDADLAYKLPGDNVTLGELCRAMGQVEQAYIDSFRTGKHRYSYPDVDAALETSMAKLKVWYQSLDEEMDAALRSLSQDDVQTRMIQRSSRQLPAIIQFHDYRQALLIFYTKASMYLKALRKPLPQQMKDWIG